jgi:hypothetical protein
MDNSLKLQYQEHWTQLEKTIKEVIEEKIGIVNSKNKTNKTATKKYKKEIDQNPWWLWKIV